MGETVTTIKLGNVNAYLVKVGPPPAPQGAAAPETGGASQSGGAGVQSGGFVLVDTGLPWSWPRLRAALEAEGCRAGMLRLVVITHGDLDHTGSSLSLRREYSAPIGLHPLDVPMVEKGLRRKRQSRGLRNKIMGRLMGLLAKTGRFPEPERFTPDVLLEDGQSLTAYGWDARVIHIPGHTEGSVAVLSKEGALFSGDTLFGKKHPALFVENLDDMRASVTRLRELEGVTTTVYPGHGDPFPAGRMGLMEL